MDGIQTIGQCRWSRLQNDRGLDLVQLPIAHRRHRIPTGAGRHEIGPKALAAPGAQDDVRGAADDFAGIAQDAVLAERAQRALRKDIIAAGDTDQFAYPANSGNERLVPFLEIHAWPTRQQRRRLPHALDMGFEL